MRQPSTKGAVSIHQPIIISLTEAGKHLSSRLQEQIDGCECWYKPAPFASKVQQAFVEGRPLIFICATGIVMRTLAPVLINKREDPPVLVIDELGRHVVSLLSGHEGGANEWAAYVATLCGGVPVITSSRSYLNPVYAVGMGCERGCPVEHLQALFDDCLGAMELSSDQVSNISSIDIKSDELGLIELGRKTNKPYLTFGVEKLSSVEHLLSVKSDYVFNTVGVYGVAESAALVAATELTGQMAELVFAKRKTAKATCAIARSYREPNE